MKWPRWLPRLATEPIKPGVAKPRRIRVPTPPEQLGIREVGNCEVCGGMMQARTRREEFRGRVDCDCGSRNHVEYRDVRSAMGLQPRYITITMSRRFDAVMHKPDLRLNWRYGVCPSCSLAISLADAHIIAREHADGTTETIAYFCSACHTHDDDRRGRLMGHDGSHVVDTLTFQAGSAQR